MTGMEFADIFNTVMSAITPIAVAIIGYFQVRKSKSDKTYRALRDQNEKMQKEQEAREKKESADRLEKMEDGMEKIMNELSELRKEVDIQKIEKQLSQLHFLNEFNFEYIQSLSGVVLTMGDTLSSSSILDEESKHRLQEEVASHKSKETEITKKLYKVIA